MTAASDGPSPRRTATRGCTRDRVPAPDRHPAARSRRRWRGRTRRPRGARPRAAPRRGSPWSGSSSRGGWPARRSRPRPKILDACLVAAGRRAAAPGPRWSLGGRSAGARVRLPDRAPSSAPRGVLALAFPLHPPGRPESSRLDELLGVRVPTLVVQGERDPFGTPGGVPAGRASSSSCPTPTTGCRCRSGRARPDEAMRRLDAVVERGRSSRSVPRREPLTGDTGADGAGRERKSAAGSILPDRRQRDLDGRCCSGMTP